MPICITCSTPVRNLYTSYSKADDRSLGRGVRLTQCPNCKRFADKYVEHDFVVLFIDLVLIKPQVYRHLLFNRLGRTDDTLDPSIIRLGVLLLLFDVYLTWAQIERAGPIAGGSGGAGTGGNNISGNPNAAAETTTSSLHDAPILVQYLFFLTLNTLATLAHHSTIRFLVRVFLSRKTQMGDIAAAGSGGGGGGGAADGSNSMNNTGGQSSFTSPDREHVHAGAVIGANTGAGETASGTTHPASSPSPPQPPPIPNLKTPNPTQPEYSTTGPTTPFSVVGPGPQASPSAISTALLVSSCTKLFPILLVIWPTTGTTATTSSSFSSDSSPPPSSSTPSSSISTFSSRARTYVSWAVLFNNIEALLILLDCGYVVATGLAVSGAVVRWAVESAVLAAVGLDSGGGGLWTTTTGFDWWDGKFWIWGG